MNKDRAVSISLSWLEAPHIAAFVRNLSSKKHSHDICPPLQITHDMHTYKIIFINKHPLSFIASFITVFLLKDWYQDLRMKTHFYSG